MNYDIDVLEPQRPLDALEWSPDGAAKLMRVFRAANRSHPDAADDLVHFLIDYRDLREESALISEMVAALTGLSLNELLRRAR